MMNKEEMIFDVNEDIIMQIEMNSYMEYNDRIARMNEYIGEIYSYKDIEDMEALQEHHEKELAYKAIKQLQQENKQLKEQLCNRTDCSGRIKNSKKYDSLQQRIDKAIEYIEKNSDDMHSYISICLLQILKGNKYEKEKN